VLAAFLDVPPDRIRVSAGTLYTFKAFFNGNDEAYLVLTDEEATIAAEHAVEEKCWFICLETLFAYFDIDSYPSDVPGRLRTREIRRINEEIKALISQSCGFAALKEKMLAYGNRKNLLADYNQTEHRAGDFLIYRLY
jgi:hypothetical protein